MTSIEAAQEVLNTKSCHLLRRRLTTPTDEKGQPQYDVKPSFTGRRGKWFYLDMFTANAIVTIYNALKEESKPLAHKVPVERMAKFAFDHLK